MSAKISTAIWEVMSQCGYVQKTGRNDFHKYNYAGENDLLSKIRPAMLKAGLILIPSIETISEIDIHGNTHVRVAYTLAHKDGDVWPEKIIAAGSGNDKSSKGGVGDKGVYKAITGANKYLLFKLFQIATGDEPESDHCGADNGIDESITSYVTQTLALFETFTTAADLKAWWMSRRQTDMRSALDIVNGKKEYETLFNAFMARGKALSVTSKIEDAA
jgi:ERF superfamily